MYEHLSKRMEHVISIANEIATEYEQDYVGTEHLLIALAREGGGGGAVVLRTLKIDEHTLQRTVDEMMKKSMEDTWVFGRLPGTPHFRNVMAQAITEAQALKANHVCTEHLLLALACETGSMAQVALAELGATAERVREVIRNLPRTSPGATSPG